MARINCIDGVNVEMSAEEEAIWDQKEQAWNNNAFNRAIENLRFKRNNLLAKTDWTALSDSTLTDNMKTYRQALRDLPSGKDTVAKCENATWPTKP